MTELVQVPVAEFKRNFHQYAGDVQRGGSIRVTSHGRPIGDFVPSPRGGDRPSLPAAPGRGGFLSIIGLFAEWDGIEEEMNAVVASRRRTRTRPVPDPAH